MDSAASRRGVRLRISGRDAALCRMRRETNVTPRETYEDGYIVNCILDAGYESMKKNKWVKVRT